MLLKGALALAMLACGALLLMRSVQVHYRESLLASYLANVLSPRIVPRVRDGTFPAYFVVLHPISVPLAMAALGVSLWALPPLIEVVFPAKCAASTPALRVLLAGGELPVVDHRLLVCHPPVRRDVAAAISTGEQAGTTNPSRG